MRGARAWLWLTLILTLGGCGQNPGAPTTPAVVTPPQPAVAPLVSPVPGSNLSPDQQQAVAAALQDAATHLGVAASEVSVQQIEAREWGDSWLGCPQPGILYSQVSAKKNFPITERVNLQFRFDFQNPFHNYGFNNPSSQLDVTNPKLFGKITGDQTTASFNGQPLMNLMLRLSF